MVSINEALRYAPYLKKGGKIIVNSQEIDPMPVITGAAEYPHEALEHLSSLGVDVDCIDALTPALEAGSAKATNIVLMGRLSKSLDIDKDKWIAALKESVAPKFVEMNIKAFELGRA
ncbi:MAG: 2-oxoacid:acceptor oxidoreductase family protein [Clostridia bacterium]|nr:2-oxoacid:acceptor oxidoreductase family protein [Clostridia bacterium]